MSQKNKKQSESIYIALDIETTGFDPIADQLIEIAIIKFQDGKIIGQYETLINPQVTIPPMITHITGIKGDDVAEAPFFDDVAGKIVEFIGKYPIVGHNISFDVNFLNQKGLHLTNELYDTLQLSTILLPGLASYSLEALTRILDIKHENKHRAMSDTIASFDLFNLLEQKLNEIDEKSLTVINQILNKSTWSLKPLFENRLRIDMNSEEIILPESKNNPEQSEKDFSYKVSDVEMLNIFESNGALSLVIKDYEERPSQKKMAEIIGDAFANNKQVIIEAGTGTGKTLAYLAAASEYNLRTNQKVIASTFTHNLQDQLLLKDLPLLNKALEKIGIQPRRFALLKGRKNYLSLRRLQNFLNKNAFLDHEVCMLLKIVLWLPKTTTGDLNELTVQGKEFTMLDDICCSEHLCPHDDNEFKSGCFLIKARRKAEHADIIVVNHALLLQDTIAESPLLPDYDHLIIDEAHHLENVATDSLTLTLSMHNFLKPFEKMLATLDQVGMLRAAVTEGSETVKISRSLNNQLISRIEIFFGLIGIFFERYLQPNQYQAQINLRASLYQTAEWEKITQAAGSVKEQGGHLIHQLRAIEDNNYINHDKLRKEFKSLLLEIEQKFTDLNTIMNKETLSQRISWIYKTIEGNISVKSAPYNIGEKLKNLLFDKKRSCILTSATLRTDPTFNFFREQLSLGEEFQEYALPSHFSYPDQVKILIPQDLAEPMTEGYFMQCSQIIEKIIQKNGGRTLVLFTSKKALSATYFEIAPRLKEKGFTVLAQNVTGGRGKILEHFKDEPDNSAIFGTASFWEGVDIPGKDLTCVVMLKLPFDPPDDPLIVARSQKYTDSFKEFQLPRAILKFKQGFGRLIRTSKDTGSIVILDTRIVQKSYGPKFIQSLPEGIKVAYTSREELATLL
jgi:DNA polymerase-3 subunit epsilon/ATP-dependent DNA helicase DinG